MAAAKAGKNVNRATLAELNDAYVDAPLCATGKFSSAESLQSGAVVCPASSMRLLRPRARMVSADRIQIAPAGSKPCC